MGFIFGPWFLHDLWLFYVIDHLAYLDFFLIKRYFRSPKFWWCQHLVPRVWSKIPTLIFWNLFFYIPIIALLGTYLFRSMYTRTMTKTVELSISGKFTFDFGLPLVVIFIYHVKLETVASWNTINKKLLVKPFYYLFN